MAIKRQAGWFLTVVGGICLGAAGVGLSQSNHANVPTLPVAAPHAPDELSTAFRDVASKVLPSVVSISTETSGQAMRVQGNGGGMPDTDMFRQFFGNDPRFEQFFGNGGERGPMMTPRQRGAGSGFIVDSDHGIVVTNSHVVEGADKIIVTLDDGHEIQAESWNFDPRSDVAIIRLKKTDVKLPPGLVFGDSNQMQIGDWVLAMGNPFQLGNSVTTGIVSATGRGPQINERESFIQTDAAINPGNSGGPLVNLYGEVIGINTAISTRSGGYDGVGFAIPSSNARWVADQLIQSGEVKRSYLGVALSPMTQELREQLNAPFGQGALVREVFGDTPAAKAKLLPADVILEFAGEPIRDVDQLTDHVERAQPNQSYDLRVLRDGKEVTVAVWLEQMPSDFTDALRRVRAQDTPDELVQPQSSRLDEVGLEVEELTRDMAGKLKLDPGTAGVVVKNVSQGSPAAAAGLQAGDVIQRIGRESVGSPDEVVAALSKADLDRGVAVYFQRGNRQAFSMLRNVQ